MEKIARRNIMAIYEDWRIFRKILKRDLAYARSSGGGDRSTGRTARFMDFVADQLIELFAVRFYSMLTSSPTS